MPSRRTQQCGLALALGVAFLAGLQSPAQSLDPEKPAALAPGINKGNVDNGSGSHYYYFWAGPGHFDVRMAFKEMGFMGSPYRQSLSFDAYNDKNELVSHSAIESLGKLAEFKTGGDYTLHKKVRLAVIPQKGLVKMGGYYEIEVTGAVQFDAAQSTTGGVKPVDTSLYHPAGPLVSSGSLVQPTGSLVHPVGPLTKQQTLIVSETGNEIHIVLAADVLFDFDQATIRPDAASALKQAADVIRQHHGTVRVQGYTDSKGKSDYNLRLSNQRAVAVETWLVRNEGFEIATFKTQGFGSTHPVASNTNPDGSDNPEGRQRNRRVELIVAK